jgi:hypothetical protein
MTGVTTAKASLQFTVHPAALAAYDWLHQYPQLIDWSELPSSLLHHLMTQPLFGIMSYDMSSQTKGNTGKQKRIFQLYAPLWQLRIWSSDRPPEGTLLIYSNANEMSEQSIELSAWLSVISYLLQSVDSKRLALIRDSLHSSMPAQLHFDLLGTNKLSDSQLCRWTHMTRGTLVQQRSKLKQNKGGARLFLDETAVIAALNEPWNGNDE